MAKRFTDTDKWKREWFCDLDIKAKIVWFYLLDQCDHRGVWYRNFKLMSDQVGFKVNEDNLKKWYGAKLHPFDNDKYFIPSFVDFQYGELNPSNNAHKSVIELLSKLGPIQPLNSPLRGAQDKEEDKEKDKDNVLGEYEGGFINLPRLADLWNQHCVSMAKVRSTNAERNKRAAARYIECNESEWIEVLQKIEASDFCKGKNEKGWKATFDWLLQPAVRLKVIEGTYDNRITLTHKKLDIDNIPLPRRGA